MMYGGPEDGNLVALPTGQRYVIVPYQVHLDHDLPPEIRMHRYRREKLKLARVHDGIVSRSTVLAMVHETIKLY